MERDKGNEIDENNYKASGIRSNYRQRPRQCNCCINQSRGEENIYDTGFETEEQVEKLFCRLRDLSVSEDFYQVGIFYEGNLIGFANEVERENGAIELGYVIHPKYHNQGYATEMLMAMIEQLWKEGFSEIITGAFKENRASIRVMEKCGMKKLDKMDQIEYKGVNHTCVYYSKKKNPQ